ncbi:hypothetical protein CLOM_g10545 [Closterium sp. NIES-68]|nr:hypothetical protein CLOM_g10545 [Closterium sp. NIES-68]GJP59073.1 hypothetical protein CLOP_g7151 [Closterium sp. NIES-67]
MGASSCQPPETTSSLQASFLPRRSFQPSRSLSVAAHSPAASASAAVVTGLPGAAELGVKALQPSRGETAEVAGEAGRSKLVEAFQIQAASDPIRGFMVALRKSELSFETGLALRDLRVVISALQNQIPTILIRPRAIVVSLAHVRAVITANRAYILNTSSPRVRQRLIPNLLRRLSASQSAAAAAAACSGGESPGDGECNSCSPDSAHPSSSSPSFSGSDPFFSGAVSVFSDCGGEPAGREVGGSEVGREQKGWQQREQPQQQEQRQEWNEQAKEARGGDDSRCWENGREVRGVCVRGHEDEDEEEEARTHGERREGGFLEEEREERRDSRRDEQRDNRRDDRRDDGGGDCRGGDWEQGWQEEVSERRREEWRARRQREEERRRNKRWLEDLEKESKGRFSENSNGEEEDADGHLIGSDGQWERHGEVFVELTLKGGLPLKTGQKTQGEELVAAGGDGREGKGYQGNQSGQGPANNNSSSPLSAAALSLPRVAPTPFEFQVLEALLDEVGVTLKVKYASIFPGVYQGLRAFAGGRVPYERAMAEQEAFLRAKNELLRLEMSANQICNAVREVLSNDEDMAEMYLSRKASLPPGSVNSVEHSEVEELLEDYLRRMEEVVGEAQQLLSMSDATSEYLRTALDSARNQLIELDVLVNMATCSMAVGGSIAAIFGMNLISSLEETSLAFPIAAGSVLSVSALVFLGLRTYARRRGITGM